MDDPRVVRIFISSPGDVAEEREKARAIVAQLQRFYGEERVRLVALLWEDLPLQIDTSFQEGVDAVISDTHGIDIAVFILWSRLGTPTGPSIRRPDGTEYDSGTVRELELMLAAREASAGVRPAILAYIRNDDDGIRNLLSSRTPEEMLALLTERQRAQAYISQHFDHPSGANLRAHHRYEGASAFASRFRTHLRALLNDMLIDDNGRPPRWTQAPYLGLETFGVESAPIFFGREREACEIEEALFRRAQADGRAFLCIIGASGSGKSSLIRAGVVANLIANAEDSHTWRAAFFLPRQAAGSIVGTIAQLLWNTVPELASRSLVARVFCEEFVREPEAAVRLSIVPALASARAKVVLVVDQLEELFTTGRFDANERAEAWRAIDALAQTGYAAVLTTLRSDFYAVAQRDPGFLQLKGQEGHIDLAAPTAEGFSAIIRQPALLAGVRFERSGDASLEARILSDALAEPDALPLLEYLLEALWHARQGNLLTITAYENLGGVSGAIARRAETTFLELSPGTRAALPGLLRRLATVRGDEPVTSRPVPLSTLKGETEALATALLEHRLLLAEGDADEAHIRVTHEALLQGWPRARQLIESDRERMVARARLEDAFQRWGRSNRPRDLLLPAGLSLDEAEILVASWRDEIAPELTSFVEASRRRIRRQRRIAACLFAAAMCSLVALTLWAMHNASLAQAARSDVEHRATEVAARLRDAQIAGSRLLSEFARQETAPRVGVLLALESLPIGHERPLVPEALSVLGKLARNVPLAALEDRGEVDSATISPDGRLVLTTAESEVSVWDARDGRHLHRLEVAGSPHDGTFAPSASRAAFADGTTAILIDAASGRITARFEHGQQVRAAKFLDHGGKIATIGGNEVVIWRVSDEKPELRIANPNGDAYVVVTDTRLASTSRTGVVTIWDVRTGRKLRSVQLSWASFVAVSDDTLRALFAAETEATIWDLESGSQSAHAKLNADLNDAAFSPDHEMVLLADSDGAEYLWRLGTKDQEPSLIEHEGVWSVSFQYDGRVSVERGIKGVVVREVATSEPLLQFTSSNIRIGQTLIGSVSFPRSGLVMKGQATLTSDRAVSSSPDSGALLWNVGQQKPVRSVRLDGSILALRAMGDNILAFAGSRRWLWDPRGGLLRSLGDVDGTAPRRAAARPFLDQVTSSAKHLAFVTAEDDVVTVVDAMSGAIVQTLHPGIRVSHLALDGNGSRIVVLPLSRPPEPDAMVLSLDTGKVLYRFPAGADAYSVAFSPDGTCLVTTSSDSAVIWDAETGRRLHTLVHEHTVYDATFSADGRRVATAGDGGVAIWDSLTGSRSFAFDIEEGSPEFIRFDAAGKRLVTGNGSGPANVWDAETGQRLAVLATGSNAVAGAWTPGGQLVIASDDDTLTYWEVPPAVGAENFIASVRAQVLALGWCLSERDRARYFLSPMPPERRTAECRSSGRAE